MIMKNLGKCIALLMILCLSLFADVKLTLQTPVIYSGDSATFSIDASGGDVEFPDIDQIGGYAIAGTGSSQSLNITNGKATKTISKTYTFAPKQSITIPKFEVIIDGKKYWTQEAKISVVKPSASKNGDDFILALKADKNEARVGESIKLELLFKYRANTKIYKFLAQDPKMDNFWIKKLSSSNPYVDGEYIVEKTSYLLFPQKAGSFTFPSIMGVVEQIQKRRTNSAFNDPFFDMFANNRIKQTKIYSNTLAFHIKPLPDNLEVYGDYSINASVDKDSVKANEPVNLTIRVNGEGNIDDIKKYNLDIPKAVIYADEPKITPQIQNGEYGGNFSQKIAIISGEDYTIPAIKLTYFDSLTKQEKSIQTAPIKIKVAGLPAPEKVQIATKEAPKEVKTKTIIKHEDWYKKYLFGVVGLFLGAFLMFMMHNLKKSNPAPKHINAKIKSAKTDKELFELLLPYSKKDKFIALALAKLEENLYKGAKNKIDKNALMDIFDGM